MSDIYIHDDTCKNNNLKRIFLDNIYEFYELNNIINYDYINFNSWKINLYNIDNINNIDNTNNNIQYYLIIDTLFNDAFLHWVVESAIFLPSFKKLKENYPNIKIHIKIKRKYKDLFIKFFNIDENDIVYNIEKNNISFFPIPNTSLNNNSISDLYINYFNNFYKYIQYTKLDNKIYDKILILPRGNKENYKGNDRTYNIDDIINNLIDKSFILIADNDINNLNNQIEIINKYKNIILTDGSPFFVNGLFANNSNIIVLGDIILNQIQNYKKMDYIFIIIKNKNKVNIIPYNNETFYNSFFYYNEISLFLNINN